MKRLAIVALATFAFAHIADRFAYGYHMARAESAVLP